MAIVIAHAELVSDQTSHPRTSPQWRREAVRLGPFEQQRLEAFELRGVQQRLATGTPGLAESGRTPPPCSLTQRLTLCCAAFTRRAASD